MQVSGLVHVSQNRAEIQNNGTVTAGPQTAEITLARGGKVAVCSSSTVHLTQSNSDVSPLMLSLNRGAFEVHMSATAQDVILTPDLRFDLSNAAPLDLRIRVTPNGDTCVENRGKDSPVLHVTEQFGVGGYFVNSGQRVLFEHGSVHEVVDRESSLCGCPAPTQVLAGNSRHPFPEAVSQGLEQPQVPQAPMGEVHTQVSATVVYNGNDSKPASPAPASTTPQTQQETAASPPAKPSSNPFRAIGHFFKRLFGGGS